MHRVLRLFVTETFGLYVASSIASGIHFTDTLSGLVVTGAALALASMLIKPIVNLLILPLTLATLGLFKFVSHAITLYIVDLALNQFSISSFHFPGLTSAYLDLPAIYIDNRVGAYLAFSLVIFVLTSFVHWLMK